SGLDIRWGNASFAVVLNVGGPKAGRPSALTVFRTGVLKFHERVFLKNILRRGLSEDVGREIWGRHLGGLKSIVGQDVLKAVLSEGEGPHLASLPGGFEALLELLTSTARAVERELGVERAA